MNDKQKQIAEDFWKEYFYMTTDTPDYHTFIAFCGDMVDASRPLDAQVIKPCPFCGEKPEHYTIGRKEFDEIQKMVRCKNGNCVLWNHPFFLHKWNERVL